MSDSTYLLPGYDAFFYWTASYAARNGINVYNPDEFRKILELTGYPNNMFDTYPNPPWSIWLFYLFSFLPFEISRPVWLAIIVGIALVCIIGLPKLFSEFEKIPGSLFVFISLLYPPVLGCFLWGNHSIILLLGLYLLFKKMEQGADLHAGIFVSLLFLKPHLFLPLFAALPVLAIRLGRTRLVLGFCLGIVLQVLISWWLYPKGFGFFIVHLWQGGYSHHLGFKGITLAQVLPDIFIGNLNQIIFPIIGVVLGLIAGLRLPLDGSNIQLRHQILVLLPIGVLMAPYSWSHSLVILFPIFVYGLIDLQSTYLSRFQLAYIAAFVAAISVPILLNPELDWLFFFPLVILTIFTYQKSKGFLWASKDCAQV